MHRCFDTAVTVRSVAPAAARLYPVRLHGDAPVPSRRGMGHLCTGRPSTEIPIRTAFRVALVWPASNNHLVIPNKWIIRLHEGDR